MKEIIRSFESAVSEGLQRLELLWPHLLVAIVMALICLLIKNHRYTGLFPRGAAGWHLACTRLMGAGVMMYAVFLPFSQVVTGLWLVFAILALVFALASPFGVDLAGVGVAVIGGTIGLGMLLLFPKIS